MLPLRAVRPADPRSDAVAVARIIAAARRARTVLRGLGNLPTPGAGPDEVAEELEAALAPLDAFDADDDDTAETSRYRFGCAVCSMATDELGYDRDGDEHAVCPECEEVDGEGCAASSIHAEHLQHEVGECWADVGSECSAPGYGPELRRI